MYKVLIILLLPFLTYSQNCSICPAGTVQLSSSYPATANHFWSCSNGFTSNLQNPTITVSDDVTCNLTVTEGDCIATSTSIIDVCNCVCNDNACTSINYNATTDCVTFADIGTPCSAVDIQTREWRNLSTNAWAAIPGTNQICDCNIKEYVNTTASVVISGSDFRLQINGLQNRCNPCAGSDMRIDFTFGVTGWNSSLFPGCSGTTDWYTISPANFANAGYVANAYVRYTTPWGVVVNHYRFSYNGGGLNVANVTVTTVSKKSIYKKIETRRTISFTDGCAQVVCQNEYQIPQQPNDPCAHFFAYVNTVNLGSPCNGSGLSASTINATTPLFYQWLYNGSNISGATSQYFCLVGQPNGTYCCNIFDSGGCSDQVCIIVQPPCALTVNVTSSGNTLTASLTNCSGTPTYQWARWTGASWQNVGTNSSTYNTGGISGDYRVTVNCTGCSAIGYITYTVPCTNTVTITVGSTTLTATSTGCGGVLIEYIWERWNGTSWVIVSSTNTTATTNIYSPTQSGLYKVTTNCSGCSATAQTSYTLPNPCSGFSAIITGTFTGLCSGSSYTYNKTITGGTSPFSYTWKINGTTVGTGISYTYTASAVGTYTLTLTIVDANNCTYTDTKNLSVINCCGLSVSLTPDITVCTNQIGTFTATATGGNTPYTYNWFSQLSPNPPVAQGSGNPKSFTFSNTGTYTIQVTATDAVGCTAISSRNMVVQSCTDCTCTPFLNLNNCILTAGMNGSGCGNYTYQLQYSATGTGWSILNSGTASNGYSFNHTPTQNGFYRMVIASSSCILQEVTISVNCVIACGCTAGTLTYNTGTCQLSWTNQCPGYLTDLEFYNGTSWVVVSQISPYTPSNSGNYRVAFKKGGCPTVYSNAVAVTQNSCPSQFYFHDDDFNFDLYVPIHDFIYITAQTETNSTPNYSLWYVGMCYDNFGFGINWGDGNSGTFNSQGYFNHIYSTNGAYLPLVTSTLNGHTINANAWINANGCLNNACEKVNIIPSCGDGAHPVFYIFDGCSNVELFLDYTIQSINFTPISPTHYVKIDNVNYTVPMTNPFTNNWSIQTYGSGITFPYDTNWHSIEVGFSWSGNTIYNKGYFKMCN